MDFSIVGPDGKQVPWQGRPRIDSKEHSPSEFTVLQKYQEITVERIISPGNGAGFVFDKAGQYTITAEYSPGPPEHLAPFAGEAKIPTGPFRSMTVDGHEIAFDDGFADLHSRVYAETLAGRGFTIADARPSIDLVHRIRTAAPVAATDDAHPRVLELR